MKRLLSWDRLEIRIKDNVDGTNLVELMSALEHCIMTLLLSLVNHHNNRRCGDVTQPGFVLVGFTVVLGADLEIVDVTMSGVTCPKICRAF